MIKLNTIEVCLPVCSTKRFNLFYRCIGVKLGDLPFLLNFFRPHRKAVTNSIHLHDSLECQVARDNKLDGEEKVYAQMKSK